MKYKIFAVPSHQTEERTSGVDFARVLQPAKYLNGYRDKDVEFKVDIFDIKDKTDWHEVARSYDAVFLNYTTNDWGFAHMGWAIRREGKKIILDMDDDLWDVLPDNFAHQMFKKGGDGIKNVTAICNEVDLITCTNRYLKNVIMHNTRKNVDQVDVCPNRVDLDLYAHRPPFKDNHEIVLAHFGSSSHFVDLQEKEFEEGINMVFKEFPNVRLKTVGALVPRYKQRWGERYDHGFGDVDVYKWIKEKFPLFMDETDIMVVPLTENTYNRCKSAIKFLESSSAKKPGVWQNIRQYREVVENGKNGFLATTAFEWYSGIKSLIEKKSFRKKMGEEAFKTASKWQAKDGAEEWAKAFKKVLTTPGNNSKV